MFWVIYGCVNLLLAPFAFVFVKNRFVGLILGLFASLLAAVYVSDVIVSGFL